MKKRLNKKLHKKYLDDTVLEISISTLWRNEIFNLNTGQFLIINKASTIPLPPYIKPFFYRFKLEYVVRIVEACPEYFDEELIIFEFSPKLFSKIKRYSGNNQTVK